MSDIGKLTNLERLHLKYNKLTAVPDDLLGRLVKIRELDVEGNKLVAIPEDIRKLKDLSKL
jgi:Leucine-rich repeat (LRR) protein